jgi:hypothetical protein
MSACQKAAQALGAEFQLFINDSLKIPFSHRRASSLSFRLVRNLSFGASPLNIRGFTPHPEYLCSLLFAKIPKTWGSAPCPRLILLLAQKKGAKKRAKHRSAPFSRRTSIWYSVETSYGLGRFMQLPGLIALNVPPSLRWQFEPPVRKRNRLHVSLSFFTRIRKIPVERRSRED